MKQMSLFFLQPHSLHAAPTTHPHITPGFALEARTPIATVYSCTPLPVTNLSQRTSGGVLFVSLPASLLPTPAPSPPLAFEPLPSLAPHLRASPAPGGKRGVVPGKCIGDVEASVDVLGPNSRRVSASIDVAAPLTCVWSVLTDYAKLADFVPSLARNEVLEVRERGARLLQVGEQDVALGLKFQARVVMDVEEEPEVQVPLDTLGSSSDGVWPIDRMGFRVSPTGELSEDSSGSDRPTTTVTRTARGSTGFTAGFVRRRAIQFTMLEGDFANFSGRWTMQEQKDPYEDFSSSASTTRLSYSVEVTPHFWLPVALIEGRIVKEIGANLSSVAVEACKRAG